MEDPDVCVLAEDQKNINTFSCLNQRIQELQADCEHVTEEIQRLKDAEEEVLISVDADGVLLRLGECFVPSTDDGATKLINMMLSVEERRMQTLSGEIEEIKAQMTSLKTKLYGKFGKVINLDA